MLDPNTIKPGDWIRYNGVTLPIPSQWLKFPDKEASTTRGDVFQVLEVKHPTLPACIISDRRLKSNKMYFKYEVCEFFEADDSSQSAKSCTCNIMVGGCTCGVMEAERRARQAI